MKQFVVIISMLITSLAVQCQNLPNADFKRFQFGFNVGMNVMDFGIKPSMLGQDGVVYEAEVSSLMPGFTVGLIGAVRLGEYFSLRLMPGLNLGERTLSYVNNKTDDVFKTTIKSTTITVPLHFKYSSVRINNVRPYLLAGGGVLFDLAHDKSKPVLLNYVDYFVEFGVGCTFYFQYFRFSPEIRFALGFDNILTPWDERLANPGEFLDPEYEKYTNALSKLTTRFLTISFNFE